MKVAAAIADEVRREILESLRDGPQPVNRLAARFPISRPAISRHLRVLREVGLVRIEQRGREHWCHLQIAPLTELDAWLARFRPPLTHQLDALETEVARTRRARTRRPGTRHPGTEPAGDDSTAASGGPPPAIDPGRNTA